MFSEIFRLTNYLVSISVVRTRYCQKIPDSRYMIVSQLTLILQLSIKKKVMKKILLLCLVFAIAMLGAKAQIGGGYNFAMNFGGGGVEVTTTSVDASNNTYFTAQVAAVAKFAGQNIGATSTGTFPTLTNFIGKISAGGTQTLIRNFGKYSPLKSVFSPNGDFYGFFKGDKNTPVNLGDNILLDDWGLYLVKFNSTGVVQFFKKIAIGVALLSAYPVVSVNGMQVAADGNLYFGVSLNNNGDAQSPYPTAKFPTLVAKYDDNGNAVWSNTYYGDSRAYVFMGNQFVSNDGRVTFGISAQSSDPFFLDGVNITPDMSAFITQYASTLSIVVSLKPDGTKNFSIADGVVAVYFRNVDPNTGKIYLFYSYLVQPNVFDTRRPSKAPFTSLPNQGMGAIGAFNGLLSFDNTGAYLGYGNIPTANQTSNTLLVTNNGFVNYYNYSANSSVDLGNGYAFGDAKPFSVVAYYDQNFNFLKAVKSSSITSIGANGNTVSFGGTLSADYTFGNTTLVKNYNDPAFASNNSSYYTAYKNDLYIAQADAANIVAPAPVTWLGIDNNWDNVANWSDGKVPNVGTIVKFNANTPAMPTTGSTPKALSVTVDAGITAQLPSDLQVASKIIINGKLEINHTGALQFNGYSAGTIEGTGTVAFNGSNTPSVYSTSQPLKGLTLETNEDMYFLYPPILKKLKFTGTSSIIKLNGNNLEITSPDEDAILGYSATNLIEGGLTRAVNANGTYVFPGRPGNLNYEPATLTLNNLQGVQKINAEFKGAVGAPNYKFPDGSIANVVLGYSSGSNYSYGNSVKFSADAEPTSGTYDVTLQRSNFNNGVLDANKERYLALIDGKFEGTKLASTQVGGTINGQTVSNATVTAAQSGLKKFGEFLIAINSAIVPLGTTIANVNWTGAIDGNWNTAGNWSGGVVPNGLTNVTIPTVSTQYPSVYSATDFVNSLTINSGVTDMSLSHVLNTNLGITNNGDVKIEKIAGTNTVYNGNILGKGKARFEANSGLTKVNLNTSNNVEVNIGDTNSLEVAGGFSGNFNVKSGIITYQFGANAFAVTNPNAVVQITAPINGISNDSYLQTVKADGTFFFPLISSSRNQTTIRNYGGMTITNHGITTTQTYNARFESHFKVPVSTVSGSDFYNDFLNSGQWYITPNAVSTTGTIDVSFTTSGYSNGRTNLSDYILLRRASTLTSDNFNYPWVAVNGATFTESAGTLTASINGIPAISTLGVTFCIGLKASITTWTGETDANWNVATNWSNGVPSSTVKAIIGNATVYPINPPTTGTNQPALIEIASGSVVSLPATFSAPKGIVNNGTIRVLGAANSIFTGFLNSGTPVSISGSGRLVFDANSPGTFNATNMGGVLNNSIEVNNPAGLTLSTNTTVNGDIILTNGKIMMSAYQTLSMSNPNATITGNANAYVNGTLKRKVNPSGTYNFPVGIAGAYAPATLNLNGLATTTDITANFSDQANTQPNLTIGNNPVTSLLPGGAWTITPTPATIVGNYAIDLSAPLGTSSASSFYVLKRPASYYSWENQGTNLASTVNAGVVTASATGITSFSQFGIGKGDTNLPVTLVKFSATAESKAAKLAWETASELNNDRFEIERSTNGTDFIKIGEVKGNATSQKINNYSFRDFAPVNGLNYYRLKQLDFSGNFAYSDIKFVNFDLNEITFTIFPNPVTDIINFSETVTAVEIYNMLGVVVFRNKNSVSSIQIPNNLIKGVYVLKMRLANGSSVTKRIIVNK